MKPRRRIGGDTRLELAPIGKQVGGDQGLSGTGGDDLGVLNALYLHRAVEKTILPGSIGDLLVVLYSPMAERVLDWYASGLSVLSKRAW